MNKLIKINKYRKQLEYIDKVFDILHDTDDGNLYDDFTENEEQKFIKFIEFMTDIQMSVENKLKLVEEK